MELDSGLIPEIKKQLQGYTIKITSESDLITFRNGNRHIIFDLTTGHTVSQPAAITNDSDIKKIVAIIMSRLGLNRRIFARDCIYQTIDKSVAKAFLDKFHLMKSTTAGYTRGLFSNEELVAVASFSKGRKMRRLSPDERSYELIRFCCMHGISVSGGLSKLVKNFCREKKAGDIMSYVDARLSDGRSFINAGFTLTKDISSESPDKSSLSHKLIYSCTK